MRTQRPPIVVFASSQLIGTGLVVPAGTVVRLPDAPASLGFAGYDVCSIVATVAGLAGGDTFRIGVDTLDPQSVDGDPLPSSVGLVNVVSALVDGSVGGTLYLRTSLAGAGGGGAIFTPSSDITPYHTEWGTNGGADGGPSPFPTTWQAVNTIDDFTSYATRDNNIPGGAGSFNYQMGLSGVIDPTKTHRALVRMTKLFSQPMTGHFQISVAKSDGKLYQSDPIDVNAVVTDSWVTYALPVTTLQATGYTPNTVIINWNGPRNISTVGYLAITYIGIEELATPSGLTAQAIPFYRNLLDLDATDCAGDITVSKLMAMLSNAGDLTLPPDAMNRALPAVAGGGGEGGGAEAIGPGGGGGKGP